MGNYLNPSVISRIRELAEDGLSIRQIAKEASVSVNTVKKYTFDIASEPPLLIAGSLKCEQCNEYFEGDRRTKRSKHFFCSVACSAKYRSQLKAKEKCSRCDKSRIELSRWWEKFGITGVIFSNGYCPKCYGLIKMYDGNNDLANLHEANQQLKKGLSHERRKEHR